MSETTMPAAPQPSSATTTSWLTLFLFFAVILTVIRIVGLHFSVVDLYVDESQYWLWSRDFAFGYFSKPPLIAWLIGITDAVCGSSEACLRSSAPLIYLGTSLLIYATAAELYDRRVAFWAGLTTLLAPGIVFSSRIISTDVPLLFFWALALLSFVKLARHRSPLWAVGLAVGFGLGLLSKYAMLYFLPGLALAALVDGEARALMKRPLVWLALAAGLLFLVPNIMWNAAHGFITIHHTEANATGAGLSFHPGETLGFLGAQFGIAGPIVFAVLLILFWRFGRRTPPPDGMLVAIALPPLAIITALSFFSDANANWAATAFVSAFVVVPAVVLRQGRRGLLIAGIVIGLVAQATLLVTDAMADRVSVPFLARGDIYHRTLGWQAMADAVAAAVRNTHARAIVTSGRADVAGLAYYLRDDPPVFAWPSPTGIPFDHFQMTRPLTPTTPGPVLAVTRCATADGPVPDNNGAVEVSRFTVATGPHMSRHYAVFRLPGGDWLQGGVPRC